ncbi:hypothetical protein BLOT_002722 [Blomia tropicalis]|nr:hypothetical protein BLOT_002722 [Blomia tropicalis]
MTLTIVIMLSYSYKYEFVYLYFVLIDILELFSNCGILSCSVLVNSNNRKNNYITGIQNKR